MLRQRLPLAQRICVPSGAIRAVLLAAVAVVFAWSLPLLPVVSELVRSQKSGGCCWGPGRRCTWIGSIRPNADVGAGTVSVPGQLFSVSCALCVGQAVN